MSSRIRARASLTGCFNSVTYLPIAFNIFRSQIFLFNLVASRSSFLQLSDTCCASKHAQKLEAELARSKEEADRKLMEQAYHAAVANKPGVHGVSAAAAPATEVAVPASKRARTDNPFAVHQAPQEAASASAPYASMDTLEQIRDAYRGLKGSGSTADAMKSVAGIIGQQRERGFR